MSDKTKVTKVRFHDESTTVEYSTSNRGTPENHELANCGDGRRKSFASAIAAVEKDALAIVGLGKALGKRYRLTQVSVSEDSNGHRGFIFHGMFRTNAGEVSLGTPRMREKVESEDGETVLSDVVRKRVDVLLDEAIAFVSGQREQGELFDAEGAANAAAN